MTVSFTKSLGGIHNARECRAAGTMDGLTCDGNFLILFTPSSKKRFSLNSHTPTLDSGATPEKVRLLLKQTTEDLSYDHCC